MTTMNHYIPLARKYRPTTFAELSGQDSTATSLANAILLGREPHAVIFSGVRGVGKTTSARLYAKALNCESPTNAEPCNQCESCHAISLGTHEDVMEIDGASNTSVDDVRTLKESISYVPQRSKFKVYIIDEVHMLSQSAFNALLKTLEEPPSHVVFIFATTELPKIPQTILSRCQVFFLQRLTLTMIRDRLFEVLTAEKITFDEKARATIAREGHGSMRDAMTLLDHVIAVGNGHVSIEALSRIVSHVSSTPFIALLAGLIARSPGRVIQQLDALEQGGVDMDAVVEKTAALARHASVARDVGIDHVDFKTLGFDDQEAKTIYELGKSCAPLDINRIFRTLVKCGTELDGSALDRYIVENYCLEWCLDPGIIPLVLNPGASQKSFFKQEPDSKLNLPLKSGSNAIEAATASQLTSKGHDLNQGLGQQQVQSQVQNQVQAQVPLTSQIEQNLTLPPGPEQAQATVARDFPATWRDLVDQWKREKPLQARKLEEAHPLSYSSERIELVVLEGGYASASLLRSEEQKKLKEAFAELFLFRGSLIITATTKAISPALKAYEPALPETLASINERESESRRATIEDQTRNHPLTRDAMDLFGATIVRVDIHDT
ncbi:MAG: DNA polymerase III subunit gamma/tau [Proteobacteria bacterium]|nr:DNA polymerase III subunit gamma/tau [Pseudomonadota bacterium]